MTRYEPAKCPGCGFEAVPVDPLSPETPPGSVEGILIECPGASRSFASEAAMKAGGPDLGPMPVGLTCTRCGADWDVDFGKFYSEPSPSSG